MPELNCVQRALAVRFRRLLSGADDGNPPWVSNVAAGDDIGLYLPTDAPWIVHRDFGTLVGGIRALLMQALHPGTLTGVAQHSRYETEPLGRLAGTIRWLTVTTFGGMEAISAEASRVNRMHARVTGEYETSDNRVVQYAARDEDLLRWVHLAFTESFLIAHTALCDPPEVREGFESFADEYVELWSQSVTPLGLIDVPRTAVELQTQIDGYRESGTLVVREETLRVISFIRNPPLPLFARPIYRVLFAAAVATLRPEFRSLLALRAWPFGVAVPLAGTLLRVMRMSVGSTSPIEDAALTRLRRIGAI